MCPIALLTGEANKVLTSYHMNRHRLQISNTWLATVEAGVHKPKHWEVKKKHKTDSGDMRHDTHLAGWTRRKEAVVSPLSVIWLIPPRAEL